MVYCVGPGVVMMAGARGTAGLLLTEGVLASAEILFRDWKTSERTYMKCMSTFHVSVDESTDVTNVAQLCVWVRVPKENSLRDNVC